MLINNFDVKVSAVKLMKPLEFSSTVQPVSLPNPDEEVSLGFLSSMLAWTPTGVSFSTFSIAYFYKTTKNHEWTVRSRSRGRSKSLILN